MQTISDIGDKKKKQNNNLNNNIFSIFESPYIYKDQHGKIGKSYTFNQNGLYKFSKLLAIEKMNVRMFDSIFPSR